MAITKNMSAHFNIVISLSGYYCFYSFDYSLKNKHNKKSAGTCNMYSINTGVPVYGSSYHELRNPVIRFAPYGLLVVRFKLRNHKPVAIGLIPILGLMPQSSRILSKLLPFLVSRLMQYSSR